MDRVESSDPSSSSSSSSRSSSSSSSSYAFITHSQDTLPLSLPPADDQAPLRRRRRRTSPRDQAILEEEYKRCVRPDKARRRELTKLVNMGEKEVQIWFCNKRQAQKRRDTPLQPHEMIPSSRRSEVASSCLGSSSSPARAGPGIHASGGVSSAADGGRTSSPPAAMTDAQRRDPLSHSLDPRAHEASPLQRQHHHHQPQDVESPLAPSSQDTTKTASAHQRLQDVLNSPMPPQPSHIHPKRTTNTIAPAPRLLKRSSSIRLSTSLEGKATVILEDDITSSPPVLPPTPRSSQPSSQESRTNDHHHNKKNKHQSRRPLAPVDSKVWEFYCDNQNTILTSSSPPAPAEATCALKILRSSQPCSVSTSLGSLKRKRLHEPTTAGPTIIPQAGSASKKLRRHHKSAVAAAPPPQTELAGKKKQLALANDVSVESDKENLPPGAPVSPPPETVKREKSGLFEAVGSSSPRRIDEIECVENLLSLRGGSWR